MQFRFPNFGKVYSRAFLKQSASALPLATAQANGLIIGKYLPNNLLIPVKIFQIGVLSHNPLNPLSLLAELGLYIGLAEFAP